jgi:hypothetical protein
MTITRRQFAASTMGLVSLSMLSRLAKAQQLGQQFLRSEVEPHFVLYIQIYGAWDVCLAFDPKDRDLKLPDGERSFDQPYAMNEVRNFGGIPLAPQGQVLGQYADRLAVINGINMEADNGHIVDNMMTGFQNGRSMGVPYIQAIVAKNHPFIKQRSVPHLYTSYDGQFLAGPYANSSISAAPKDFLAFIGSSNEGDNADMETLRLMLEDYRGKLPTPGNRKLFGSYVNGVTSALNVNKTLKDYGFDPPEDVEAPEGLGNLLGQLFASGILGSATLSFGSKFQFDTHSNHYADHPLDKALIEVDSICKQLQKVKLDENHSVFEKTTIVLAAEFARTPRLNSFDGKDHNFRTNSLVAIGNKVRPGVYGASGQREESGTMEAHAALPIDLITGKPRTDGDIVLAKNVWAGFGSVLGVNLSGEFGANVKPIQFLG